MQRWNKIPSDIQKQLLSNVYCINCSDTVTIADFTATMDGSDLILKGKCKEYGGDVVRLIKSDDN